ncbi:MAG: hypothetical protein NTX05_09050 [Fusobacteria bacterium]|nr:hypothetical protein [Fusobacteriota bacterium]
MAFIQHENKDSHVTANKLTGALLLFLLVVVILIYCFDTDIQSLDHARILFGICSVLAIVGVSIIGRSH